MFAFLHHNHNYLLICMVLQGFVSQGKEALHKTLPRTWPMNVGHIVVIKVTGASFLLSDDSLLKKRIQSVCVLV
jgi:hypothetical protein